MTPEQLEQIAEKERQTQQSFTRQLRVCMAAGCLSCQSDTVKEALSKELARRGT